MSLTAIPADAGDHATLDAYILANFASSSDVPIVCHSEACRDSQRAVEEQYRIESTGEYVAIALPRFSQHRDRPGVVTKSTFRIDFSLRGLNLVNIFVVNSNFAGKNDLYDLDGVVDHWDLLWWSLYLARAC